MKMKNYTMNCPNCNAKLQFQFDETQKQCGFCLCTIKREISEEDRLMIQKEEQIKEIRTVLDNRMQLSILENKRNELSAETDKIQKNTFQMPMYSRDKDKLKYRVLGLCSPVIFLAISVMCISGKKVGAFLVFLALTGVSIPLAKKNFDKLQEEKIDINAKTAEAQAEQEIFQTNRDRKIYDLKEREKDIETQIRSFKGAKSVGFLPKEYQTDNALRFLLDKLSNTQNLSLQEAIYSYDEKIHKEKLRMQEEQREQLKITAKIQQEQMQIQQEMLRTQQEQFRMEQQRQMAQMPFQAAPQMVQQVTVINQSGSSNGEIPIMNSAPPKKCPNCGGKYAWNKCDETRSGVNVGAAVVGGMLLGPLGLLAGAVGHSVEEYRCGSCGFTRRYKH